MYTIEQVYKYILVLGPRADTTHGDSELRKMTKTSPSCAKKLHIDSQAEATYQVTKQNEIFAQLVMSHNSRPVSGLNGDKKSVDKII